MGCKKLWREKKWISLLGSLNNYSSLKEKINLGEGLERTATKILAKVNWKMGAE